MTAPNDIIDRLRQELHEAKKLLAPFAAIKPSSWYPEDGSEGEAYQVLVTSGHGDFTGAHLARVRAFLKGDENDAG